MAELRNGEKSWEHMLKPGAGFFTFSGVREFLHVHTRKMHRYCHRLDIELTPFVRSGVRTKTYKAKYRWLTEDEARRIIEHHYAHAR